LDGWKWLKIKKSILKFKISGKKGKKNYLSSLHSHGDMVEIVKFGKKCKKKL
jgi:hypothetical protein